MCAHLLLKFASLRLAHNLVAALLVSVLGACQSALPPSGDDALLSSLAPERSAVENKGSEMLARLAAAEAPRILASFGGAYNDRGIERLLASIVAPLTALPENREIHYHVTIMNSPTINAFALPDGTIFISRGMLALADDKSEVAGIIVHEMGHVIARHGVKRELFVEQEKQNTLLASAAVADATTKAKTVNDSELKIAAFSREQEFEADRIGVKLSGEAGYDPYASARFLDVMERYHDLQLGSRKDPAKPDFFSDHPSSPERIEAIKRDAAAFGPPGIGDRGHDAYLSGVDGLLYGDSPDQGYVRGRVFLHPDLGIAFTVPPGFTIDNGEAHVFAKGPDDVAIRFDAAKVPSSDSPSSYVVSGWVTGLKSGSVHPLEIGGFDAATADATASQWDFKIAVIHVGDKMYRLLFAGPIGSPETARVARATEASFRSLTPDERADLKPLRVRIVTAQPGDTPQSMARRMQGIENPEELFRILNGLSEQDGLTPGKRVKVISM
jgi:predicted Zn-dependent protease